jgi:hypothetical protein
MITINGRELSRGEEDIIMLSLFSSEVDAVSHLYKTKDTKFKRYLWRYRNVVKNLINEINEDIEE